MRKIEKQIKEYLDYCEKVRAMSPTTIYAKNSILYRFMAVTKIDNLRNLTNEVFNVWIAKLTSENVAARSINTYNTTVIAMVRYYQSSGIHIPLQLSTIRKLPEQVTRRHFYTDTEIQAAILRADFETGLMIEIMFETGMRIAELTHLKISDFSGRKIQFIGKGYKLREVYIRQDTLDKIEKFLHEKTKSRDLEKMDYLFATLNGEPPTVATIRKHLRKPFLLAGLEDFYPHALRHSFATHLQLKGASVAEIKEMMGHESIATTERYLHGFEGRLKELFDKYR